MQYLGEHHVDADSVSVHIINIPEPWEKGRYRQLMSMQFFQDRELQRRYPTLPDCTVDVSKQLKAIGMRWTAIDHLRADGHSSGNRKLAWAIELGMIIHEHSSLWEFYQSIGYDYKKKRYV